MAIVYSVLPFVSERTPADYGCGRKPMGLVLLPAAYLPFMGGQKNALQRGGGITHDTTSAELVSRRFMLITVMTCRVPGVFGLQEAARNDCSE